MSAPQRIYLVGLPGSGKSLVGQLLADRLGWPFVDLDQAIEAHAGERIPTIFARSEAAFRAIEAEVLQRGGQPTPAVIATGGGAVIDPANRTFMCATGSMVWLQVTPAIAVQRVANDSTERPLLRADAAATLAHLHQVRQPFYAEAPVTVMTDHATPDHIAHQMLAKLILTGFFTSDQAITIPVPLPDTPHTITIESGLLAHLGDAIAAHQLPPRVTIITDVQVGELYLAGVQASLQQAGIAAQTITVPAGEASKSLDQLTAIYDQLIALRHERGAAILALGGGVVGDLAGFVAATYLRGVPVIQIPTTLLAMVDSAIGGKTGINHPQAKNAIGAFYQPRAILIDPTVLLTLADRIYREGWGEIVKYGIGLDADLFADLEAQGAQLLRRDLGCLTPIIARCARIKAAIISADEREGGQRILLNYGHTIGHALEAVSGFGTLLHGEAVFLGMAVAARIAARLGMIPPEVVARQDALCAIFQPPSLPERITPEAIFAATRLDKKAHGGRVQWVLPTRIGASTTRDDVPDDLVLDVLRGLNR